MYAHLRTTLAVLALSLASLGAAAQCQPSFGLAVYSSYVLGTSARVDNGPVFQGWGRCATPTGFYGELWASQSLKDPGLDDRFGNEWDITLGIDRKIGSQWSYDLRVAHFDLANPRLFDAAGDVVMLAGTLRYHATQLTTLYVNIEAVEGYGPGRFQGGQRIDLGVASVIGPVSYAAELRRNNHIGGNEGQLVKLALRSAAPIANVGRTEVRPEVLVYQPIGRYGDVFRTQVIVGVVATW